MKTTILPVLDLDQYFQNPEKTLKDTAKTLLELHTKAGFIILVNHSISPQLISDIQKANIEFHALPLEEKMDLKLSNYLRGYVPQNHTRFHNSFTNIPKHNSQCESFNILNEWSLPVIKEHLHLSPFGGKNKWPKLPGFKETLLKYYDEIYLLSRHMIKLFSVALNLDQNYLDPFFTEPSARLRLIHYPPLVQNNSNDLYGAAPHTDLGSLTLLIQDSVEALEIKMHNEQWFRVPFIPNAIIINTGQTLEYWSNGIIKAAVHRVINNPLYDRYSIPFHLHCNVDALIEPLANCISTTNPARYEPSIFSDYYTKVINANYGFEK